MATLASAVETEKKIIIEVEFLPIPSIDAKQNCNIVFDVEADLGVCWMDLIIHYLKDVLLPNDNREAHIIKAQAVRYWLSLDQKLYRKSFSGSYLRCVHPRKV